MTEREILIEILDLYKEFSCLWDNSSSLHSNRDARSKALQTLTDKYKKIDSEATVATVKKRLDNMRTAYKRESKKVQESKTSGASPSEIYVPSLWYFEFLTFLDEKSNIDRSGIDTLVDFDDEVSEIQTKTNENQKSKRRLTTIQKQQQKLLASAESLFKNEDTAAEAYGRSIGIQLKEMSSYQRCLAEKLISEIIFYGKLDKLTLESTLNLNNNQMYDSTSETSSNVFCYSPVLPQSNEHSTMHFTSTPNIIRNTPIQRSLIKQNNVSTSSSTSSNNYQFSSVLFRSNIEPEGPIRITAYIARRSTQTQQALIQQNEASTTSSTSINRVCFSPVLDQSNIEPPVCFKAVPNIVNIITPEQQPHIEQEDTPPEENLPANFITTSEYNLQDYIIINN